MPLESHLTEVQKITLRDVFRTAGLDDRSIEDLFLLLSTKPKNVQLALYYRAIGEGYESISRKVGMSLGQVHGYINNSCDDIFQYLVKKE